MSCSLSRAAFQYGIKMSEGRKTRRFKETNDKAELDRQWKKISAVSARLGWGCCARSCHPALALLSWHGQWLCEHQGWVCSLQEYQPNIWGFSIAEVAGALFGTLVLGAAPDWGFLLWAVQQMNVPKTISLEPCIGDCRGQEMFSGSLFGSWQSWGLSWQGEQYEMGWGR